MPSIEISALSSFIDMKDCGQCPVPAHGTWISTKMVATSSNFEEYKLSEALGFVNVKSME